jgi:hypothetical protein
VFVAVNEKRQAGEVMRVAHERQLYREFLARLSGGCVRDLRITAEAAGETDTTTGSQPLPFSSC